MAEAMGKLDRGGFGILLLVDKHKHLLGTITEGDIRRAVVNKLPFQTTCAEIANSNPLTLSKSESYEKALQLMNHGRKMLIHQLPVLNEHGRVVDLVLRRDLLHDRKVLKLSVVIMAGGYGLRMRPITEKIPKPLLLLKKYTLMDRMIRQLKGQGIRDVMISTHYKAEEIKRHIKSKINHGVNIQYLHEKKPLGTAGVLARLRHLKNPVLVVNSDILTKVNIQEMYDFHHRHRGDLTAAVYRYDVKIDYGVVQMKASRISALEEKPIVSYFINAGIYLLEPAVIRRIPEGKRLDMTDLIVSLIHSGKRVVGYPLFRYWMDVGRPEDYNLAIQLERYHEKPMEK